MMRGKNPLFPRAMDALRRRAVAEFRTTDLGKLVNAMKQAGRSGNSREYERIQRLMKDIARSGSIDRQLRSSSVVREIERYARKGLKQTIMDALFSAMGPVGSVLESLLRPRGRQIGDLKRELEAAAQMLEMFGYGVTRPGTKMSPGSFPTVMSGSQISPPSLQEAARQLQELGFRAEPPPPDQSMPHPSQRNRLPPADWVKSPPGAGWGQSIEEDQITIRAGGQTFRIRRDDPLLTGEMIPVSSSNVHSIGYTWNQKRPTAGTLKVRFLDTRDGKRTGSGPLYYYYDCHPQLFIAFQRAASKGKWVWDNLRVRGTVSGHQKRYALAAISKTGYVPRKATRIGNEEWYLPRTVKGQNGREYRSRLKAQMVRRLNDGRPDRGEPSRGRPNRGRPNRGR